MPRLALGFGLAQQKCGVESGHNRNIPEIKPSAAATGYTVGLQQEMQRSTAQQHNNFGLDQFNLFMQIPDTGGGFIFACGIFAVTTMYAVFAQMAADDIEHKHGFRVEGTLANAIVIAVYSIVLTPISGLYETGLSMFGFKAPANLTQEAFSKLAQTDYISALPIESGLDAGKISVVFAQNEAVNNWILAAYYGSYAIFALIILFVCIFFTLDKKIPQIRADLENRKKLAAEARGEVYVSPEEQDRIEMEVAAKELEENRIAELKAKCAKKGLDFDTENQKYLDAQAAKQAKLDKKAAKKAKVK